MLWYKAADCRAAVQTILSALQLEVLLPFPQPFAACPDVRPDGEMLI
jgi:hypothetical protein